MKFRETLARLLYGRYGADALYNALFLSELILLFSASILAVFGHAVPVLSVISTILFLLALDLSEVGGHDGILQLLTEVGVDGVDNITVGIIGVLSARHNDEILVPGVDYLDVMKCQLMVKGD